MDKLDYYTTDELCHYGVLGMRWGVRRARNLADKARTATDREKAKEYESKSKN